MFGWRRQHSPPRKPQVLGFEELEGRCTPATFTVTTSDDVENANDGVVSLREAIKSANAAAGSTIDFDATVHQSVISLEKQLPEITKDVTIDGAGAEISLFRNEMFGAFRLLKTGLNTNVTILGLEFNLGEAPAGEGGGAILANGNLTLDSTKFYDNTAEWGGGIMAGVGTNLTIVASEFWYNTAQWGGAIAAFGSLDLSYSYLSGNTAALTGGAIYISNDPSDRKASTIFGSTLTDNNSDGYGGGIHAHEAHLTLNGGTRIQFNIADGASGRGGGVYIGGTGGSITYDNVTIEANSANSGDGVFREADVLRFDGPGSVTFIDNSEEWAGA